ncbi:hypothetical protein [Portibacter lacus]|uniref:Uncharacterized protein n=1 Tax=Portibacter lacus TaxID=1099794 RepID=A0AA37SSN5_9BACT|nr:hypothetical protein [Portibacter lacus]GLR19472.1 hypothetical protein GCM10007940_40880 [Portibacter lacus]
MIDEVSIEKIKPTIINLVVALYIETEAFTEGAASKIAQRLRRSALKLSNAVNSVQELSKELFQKIITRRTKLIEKDLKEAVSMGIFDQNKLVFILVILAEINIYTTN